MLWYCTNCTCAYAPGLPRCPQCGETDHTEAPPDEDTIQAEGTVTPPAGEQLEADGKPAGEPLPEAEPAKRTRK